MDLTNKYVSQNLKLKESHLYLNQPQNLHLDKELIGNIFPSPNFFSLFFFSFSSVVIFTFRLDSPLNSLRNPAKPSKKFQ